MYVYPTSTKRYLRQACDSLESVKKSRDGDDLKKGLISFLEATKHSTIQLQTEYGNKLAGFNEWWTLTSKKLSEDKLCKFFYNLRNKVVKGGKNFINLDFRIVGPATLNGPLQINIDGVSVKQQKGDSYEWIPKKDVPGMEIIGWNFINYPGGYKQETNSLALCVEYLTKLESVADDFIKKFGSDR